MNDFNITFFEVCELLSRSKKSISRYVRKGLLHPQRIKSQQGTLEYRFNKDDLEAFKAQEALNAEQGRQDRPDRTDGTEETGHEGQTRQDTGQEKTFIYSRGREETGQDTADQTGQLRADRTEETGQTGQDNGLITLLKETTELLKEQLKVKDDQIKDLGGKIDQLIERDRETNVLLKGLQDKVLLLGNGRAEPSEPEETGHYTQDGTGQETAKPSIWKRFIALLNKRIL